MRADLKTLAAAALLAVYVGAQTGYAGPVGPLTIFTAGTTAKASEVNDNFSAVKTAVDDNHSRVSSLEANATSPNITGNITLVPSTATTGNVLKGTVPFIHNFGTSNTFIGENAGNFTMTGGGNTASGSMALFSNTTGNHNTASGWGALTSNTTGGGNTASGYIALFSNTTGNLNTACGNGALTSNTTGGANTASGVSALASNTTGAQNTASGVGALSSNTTGGANTASGVSALASNTTGSQNTASGVTALFSNTTGNNNNASGLQALFSNTTGEVNTASGVSALYSNTTGNNNTAIGAGALFNNTTGTENIAIGRNAGLNLTTGDNNIAIDNPGVAGEANTVRVGDTQTRTFITGIRGVTTGVADAVAVVVDSSGQLGTISSSRRVKDDISDIGGASAVLMKLRPVTFHYQNDKNPKGRTLQYGLVAEEVAKVAPGLVAHSANGRIETVYYQFLAPMLLNEYQKQQRTIQAQAAELAGQTAKLEKQALEIAELRQQAARIAELEKQAARLIAVLERQEQKGMIAVAGR